MSQIVFKDGWNVSRRKCAICIGEHKTSFTTAAIPYTHNFNMVVGAWEVIVRFLDNAGGQ